MSSDRFTLAANSLVLAVEATRDYHRYLDEVQGAAARIASHIHNTHAWGGRASSARHNLHSAQMKLRSTGEVFRDVYNEAIRRSPLIAEIVGAPNKWQGWVSAPDLVSSLGEKALLIEQLHAWSHMRFIRQHHLLIIKGPHWARSIIDWPLKTNRIGLLRHLKQIPGSVIKGALSPGAILISSLIEIADNWDKYDAAIGAQDWSALGTNLSADVIGGVIKAVILGVAVGALVALGAPVLVVVGVVVVAAIAVDWLYKKFKVRDMLVSLSEKAGKWIWENKLKIGKAALTMINPLAAVVLNSAPVKKGIDGALKGLKSTGEKVLDAARTQTQHVLDAANSGLQRAAKRVDQALGVITGVFQPANP